MVDMSGYAQWNPSTVYILDDIVEYDGVIYISIQGGNLNHNPFSSPTWWARIGGGGGVNSIVAGAGISTSGSTAVVITNTGVRTLTAGTGMTVGGTTTDRTVVNDGVLQLTAGTNVSITGTKANYTISSAVDGVQTITAGANVSIGGTSANPIISATSSPLPTPQTPRDLAGATTYTITASQMANAIFYSSVSYSSGILTINLPSYADMLAQYGSQKTVPFFWGNINIGAGQVVDVRLSTLGDSSKIWVNAPIQGNSSPVSFQNYFSAHPTPYALPILQLWNGTAYIDGVSGTVSYNFMWAGFAN